MFVFIELTVADVVMCATAVNTELTSNAAVLFSKIRSLRRVILKPHFHTAANHARQMVDSTLFFFSKKQLVVSSLSSIKAM